MWIISKLTTLLHVYNEIHNLIRNDYTLHEQDYVISIVQEYEIFCNLPETKHE